MVGTGYVGLVTGTCFADSGNDVTCVDIDAAKVERLNQGEIPIYEPGLERTGPAQCGGRAAALHHRPGCRHPRMRSSSIWRSARRSPTTVRPISPLCEPSSMALHPHLRRDAIVVTKSTVPVGTNAATYARLRQLTGRECDVASNPEFLKEGAAIDDFMKPDRVVVGVRRPEVGRRAARALRAVPAHREAVSGHVARECGADQVRRQRAAVDQDQLHQRDGQSLRADGRRHQRRAPRHRPRQRIGFAFLFPGVGYGGSCFPKDVRALAAMARRLGVEPRILDAVDEVNNRQKNVLLEKIGQHFGERLAGKTIAVWGLAFKPRTDDIREAPALVLIDELLARGAKVQAHDPEAMENVREIYGDRLVYSDRPMDVLEGADALAIKTEWSEFRHPDFQEMKRRMAPPVIFDGRNLYDPESLQEAGFTYYSIGRVPVQPAGT